MGKHKMLYLGCTYKMYYFDNAVFNFRWTMFHNFKLMVVVAPKLWLDLCVCRLFFSKQPEIWAKWIKFCFVCDWCYRKCGRIGVVTLRSVPWHKMSASAHGGLLLVLVFILCNLVPLEYAEGKNLIHLLQIILISLYIVASYICHWRKSERQSAVIHFYFIK